MIEKVFDEEGLILL